MVEKDLDGLGVLEERRHHQARDVAFGGLIDLCATLDQQLDPSRFGSIGTSTQQSRVSKLHRFAQVSATRASIGASQARALAYLVGCIDVESELQKSFDDLGRGREHAPCKLGSVFLLVATSTAAALPNEPRTSVWQSARRTSSFSSCSETPLATNARMASQSPSRHAFLKRRKSSCNAIRADYTADEGLFRSRSKSVRACVCIR